MSFFILVEAKSAVIEAGDLLTLRLGFAQSRQEHAGQGGDDDQQVDEREARNQTRSTPRRVDEGTIPSPAPARPRQAILTRRKHSRKHF